MGLLDAVFQRHLILKSCSPTCLKTHRLMDLGYTAWQLELFHVHTYLCKSELEDKECLR